MDTTTSTTTRSWADATIYALHHKNDDPASAPTYIGYTMRYYRQRLANFLNAARQPHHRDYAHPRSQWIREVGEENVDITPLSGFGTEAEAIEHFGLGQLTNVRGGDKTVRSRPASSTASSTWTSERLAQLGQVSDSALAEEIGVGRSSVTHKRLALGIEAVGCERALSDDDAYEAGLVYELSDALTQADLAGLFGVATSTMSKALRREGAYSGVPEPTIPMPA